MSNLFDEWSLYSSIIANNYMRNRDLSTVIREFLAERNHSCRVVDLGCGDGWMAPRVPPGTRVPRYVGIDTSADAIARVRAARQQAWTRTASDGSPLRRCAHRATRVAWRGVRSGVEQLCLHHLSQAQKQDVLRQIRRVLTPDGSFIWTDLARHSQQTRDTYLKSLVDDMHQNRPTLRSEEIEDAVAHILSSDYPEEEQWMHDTASECGLALARTLLRDEFYGSWAFVAAPGETR